MRKLVFGLFLLGLVGAAWSAAWFYVAHETGVRFDAWLKAEDGEGRDWTCPDRAIGGYPFAISVSCTAPTYTGHTLDQTVSVEAASLKAEVALTAPRHLTVALQSPLTYRTSDGAAALKARWSTLAITMDGLPDVQTTALHGSDIVVDGSFGADGRQGGNAARLDASFATAREASGPALDFAIAIRGSAMPPIDDLLGGQAPVDIDLAGRLAHAEVADVRTPEEAIEAWRQGAGRIDLGTSRLSRAESSVSGTGTLALDEAHRLQGRLDASFVGLEPVLKRYGISGNLAAAGNLLNTLFGGGPPPGAPTTPGALNLPINFQNGRLGIGPLQTGIALPPLY